MQYYKSLVKKILEQPLGHNWSLQGFGMLRLYLTREVRLHIWDDKFMIPDVTDIHDHPWHFSSLVIAGEMTNEIYEESKFGMHATKHLIKTGEDAVVTEKPTLVRLEVKSRQTYYENEIYSQDYSDIHRTRATRGTVTLVQRTGRKELDRNDLALSYSVGIKDWVSAAPRAATVDEVMEITRAALYRYFQDEEVTQLPLS